MAKWQPEGKPMGAILPERSHLASNVIKDRRRLDIECLVPVRVPPGIPRVEEFTDLVRLLPSVPLVRTSHDKKRLAKREYTFEPLSKASNCPWVSPFGAQAKPKDGVAMLGLEDAVVDST
jgi:hypothetical protein